MSAPGTRFFIGPLTPAQQRKRQRSRDRFQAICAMQDARYLSFTEAIAAVKWERDHRFYPVYRTA